MKVKPILAAMVVAALACIAAFLFLPSAQAWIASWVLAALEVVLAVLLVLARRRAARDHDGGGMDLGRLREKDRDVSQDDTAW